ncbi:MAG: ABC transporter ATP-binding protein [Gemmatimonadota bacterium]
MTPLLELRDLRTRFRTERGDVHAVAGVSLAVEEGEALALVGESGSGKTVTALSIMGLIPDPPGRIDGGEVILAGRDLRSLSEDEKRGVRGREVAMIFQDPMTSLNPVLTVGRQLTEGIEHHLGLSRREAEERAVEMMGMVGIPEGRSRLADHPHQFSGGQRQRLMIAMALACGPSLLIADEPTTALDVTIQAQIVALVKSLQERLGMAILWITHDLAVVAGLVDRVAVMYAGHIVEEAPVDLLFQAPRHPYTIALLKSMPDPGRRPGSRLTSIEGAPPDLRQVFTSCPFVERCVHAVERCHAEKPGLMDVAPGHTSACWRWRDLDGTGSP